MNRDKKIALKKITIGFLDWTGSLRIFTLFFFTNFISSPPEVAIYEPQSFSAKKCAIS